MTRTNAADLPVLYFDAPPPPAYHDLLDGRAVAVGPGDSALRTSIAVIAGAVRRWDASSFALAPHMRVISRTGIGVDNIDLAAARAAGVVVCNTPEAPTTSTAEHAIALLLAITKRLVPQCERAIAGDTGAAEPLGLELDGRTLGLVGLGRIARRVAPVAQALGMRVIAHDPFVQDAPNGVALVDLDEVFSADVVSLHAPATKETHHMVDTARLASMPPGAFLVNCARGALIDHDALLDALDRGHLGGAALDVTEPEPLPAGHPLLGRRDVIVTPHVASSTGAGRRRLLEHAIENALAVLDGRPATTVST